MENVRTFLTVLLVVIGAFMTFLIMLQEGKGGGMAALGGTKAASIEGVTNPIRRATVYMAALFFVLAVALGFMSRPREGVHNPFAEDTTVAEGATGSAVNPTGPTVNMPAVNVAPVQVTPALPTPTVKIDTKAADTKAPESPKAIEVKPAETPRTDLPKTDASKTEAPKTDAPKAEAPKPDAPKADAPKPAEPEKK